MGLFGGSETPAEKKKRIKEQYDCMINDAQRIVENYKRDKASAQYQLKMTKDQAHKRRIEQADHSLKSAQERVKRLKEEKAAALKNI